MAGQAALSSADLRRSSSGPGLCPVRTGTATATAALAGDGVCAQLVRQMPARLTEGGTAQLLANWVIDAAELW